jgi:hypothetical protein
VAGSGCLAMSCHWRSGRKMMSLPGASIAPNTAAGRPGFTPRAAQTNTHGESEQVDHPARSWARTARRMHAVHSSLQRLGQFVIWDSTLFLEAFTCKPL